MSTFVLVHGSTHSAGAWDLVKAGLEHQRQTVIAPELPTDEPDAGAMRYADVIVASIRDAEYPIVVAHSAAGGFCRSSQRAVPCVTWYFWPRLFRALA